MTATLMGGMETEYSVTAFDAKGSPADRDACIAALTRHVARATGAVSAGGGDSDWFLPNGQRLYRDVGDHPESSTPECTSPAEVICYARAGDALLEDAVRALEAQSSGEIVVSRCNNGYGGAATTWGSHESYLLSLDDFVGRLAPQLLAHLASRIVITGAGGFNNRSPGLRFMLSPRVAHLERVTSGGSTARRPMLHTKNEPLSGGYNRLHLICGESLCSQTADYLRIGATALVVAMIDAGLDPAGRFVLRAPLAAMRRFAASESADVATRSGVRALDIQRHYLGAARANLGMPFMPAWAEECCERWAAALEALEDEAGPPLNLDWALKLTLFREHAARHGIDWRHLALWSRVLEGLHRVWRRAGLPRAHLGRSEVELLRRRGERPAEAVGRLTRELADEGFDWSQLDDVYALRAELFEIDTRFAQLGERGIFNRLDADGVVEHRVVSSDAVRAAMHSPPARGRARVRGELIRELAGNGRVLCSWDRLIDLSRRRAITLDDPFSSERPPWQPLR